MDKILDIIKKYIWVTVLIVVVGIPAISYGLSEAPILPVCGNNDWAGFWGGYLGSIIGGVITLIVMKTTLDNEKEARKRDEKIAFYDNVISNVSELVQATVILCKSIKKCMLTKKIELYDMPYEYNQASTRASLQLEMLLNTRKEIYNLGSVVEAHGKFSECINDMMKLYGKASRVKFCYTELNEQLADAEQKVIREIDELQESIQNAVKSSLF